MSYILYSIVKLQRIYSGNEILRLFSICIQKCLGDCLSHCILGNFSCFFVV